jgi:hypothetical protein
MTCEDLFSHADRRRVLYQETSREAWEGFKYISGELDRLILEEIRKAGAAGITCQAIELEIDRSHQAVSGNLRHLVEDGYVEWSELYGLTTSNCRAKKWRLTPHALTGGNGRRDPVKKRRKEPA